MPGRVRVGKSPPGLDFRIRYGYLTHGAVALDVLRRIEHAARSDRRSTFRCPTASGEAEEDT